MNDAFDPLNLDNRVSLNRTLVEPYGVQAHTLLASHALRDTIARELPLTSSADDLIANLDVLIENGDGAAVLLARRLGSYLGALVMSLQSQPGTNVFMRSYRRYWSSLSFIYVGGGIARGALGRELCRGASETLRELALDRPVIIQAPNAQHLPLLGAARSVASGVATAAVFDFGGTLIKRGVATYEASTLKALRVLPPLPSRPLPPDASPETLGAFMADVIAEGVRDSGASGVAASIACYMRDGHPLDYGAGGYQILRHVADNASHYLSNAVSQRTGRRVDVTLSHDGTTAARVFAGQPRTAVIMLGTWLGVGFAPEDASGLRPLTPGFSVVT